MASQIQFKILRFFFYCAFSVSSCFAWAQLQTEQAHSVATVVSDIESTPAGSSFRLGLKVQLEPHWHTYWLNPGDSGAPVLLEWQLPSGFKENASLNFPLPQRIDTGPIVTFGYEGEVLIWSDILVETSTPPGIYEVGFAAEWLVCEEVCIPATFDFKTKIAVGPMRKSNSEDLFTAYQEKLPRRATSLDGKLAVVDGKVMLNMPRVPGAQVIDVFPLSNQWVDNKKPIIKLSANELEVQFSKSSQHKKQTVDREEFLILATADGSNVNEGFLVEAKNSVLPLWTYVIWALIGGLILNLMPCVFPIISIKLLSLLQHSQKSTSYVRVANLMYSFGVIASFVTLALMISVLQAGGEVLGWGFQLQSPGFIVFLFLLFFVLGFNFLGLFEVQLPGAQLGSSVTRKESLWSHFLTGVLSVIVASPCTAPFMGAAMGFALSQSWLITVIIFVSLGVGLSLPYLIFAIVPQAVRRLPRPGRWMEVIKKFMAFPMWATCLWLLWVLSYQATATGIVLALSCALVFAFWLWIQRDFKSKTLRRGVFVLFVTVSVAVIYLVGVGPNVNPVGASVESEDQWQAFDEQKLQDLRQQGSMVFVDFTAKWCITCQLNKQTTLNSHSVQEAFKASRVVLMRADWTARDDRIGRILKQYGRAGVPLYLLYPAESGDPLILPEVLTPKIVMDAVHSLQK